MSGSVNKVIIIGNVVRDPEVRTLSSGSKIVNLSVATSESWRDKASGEKKEKAEFHRVVIFNERLADVAEKYLNKGSKVFLEGALQTRKWTDQSGAERYSTEIVLQQFRGELVMLGDKSRNDDSGDYQHDQRRPPSRARTAMDASATRNSPVDDLDDAIPFITCDPRFEPYLKWKIIA